MKYIKFFIPFIGMFLLYKEVFSETTVTHNKSYYSILMLALIYQMILILITCI